MSETTSSTAYNPEIPLTVVYAVFFISGAAALLYQLVWQRSLFTIYGTNSESIAVIVSAFLLGLGIGSLAGGWYSRAPRFSPVFTFAALEIGIAGFGIVSLDLFAAIADTTSGVGIKGAGVVSFFVLLIPTVLMGATLPILVTHVIASTKSVGKSVGWLYFVNTLGAAMGCFYGALWLFGEIGLSGTVVIAAGMDVLAAIIILSYWRRSA